MKKIKRIAAAAMCLSLFFTGCSKAEIREAIESVISSDEMDTELTQQVFSKKYRYCMDVPGSWKDYNSMCIYAIPDEYDILWTGNLDRSIAMKIGIYSSPIAGFDAYFSDYIKQLNEQKKLSISRSDFAEKEIGGSDYKYLEISEFVDTYDNEKYTIWSYCIDDGKGMRVFEAILPVEYANEEMHEMIEAAIGSFKKY